MLYHQREETFVCDGFSAVPLRYGKIKGTVRVYQDDGKNIKEYVQGRDYQVRDGKLYRLCGSSLPDFSQSPFYGIKPFNHENFTVWGNAPYMLYADYDAEISEKETLDSLALAHARENGNLGKLRSLFLKKYENNSFRLLIFGDSISTGCEATGYDKAYFSLFKQEIEARFSLSVDMTNRSIGGESTFEGIRRYEKVLSENAADLMLLAFGMNDQNIIDGRQTVEPEEYKKNILRIMKAAEKQGTAVVLISPCEPHPDWIHTSGRMREYERCLEEIVRETGVAFADVNRLWNEELQYKSYDDLLHNGINHPGNYGHKIYAAALKQLL